MKNKSSVLNRLKLLSIVVDFVWLDLSYSPFLVVYLMISLMSEFFLYGFIRSVFNITVKVISIRVLCKANKYGYILSKLPFTYANLY